MLTDRSKMLELLENLNSNVHFPLEIKKDYKARGTFLRCKKQYLEILHTFSAVTDQECAYLERLFKQINDAWINYEKGKVQTATTQITNLLNMSLMGFPKLIDFLSVSLTVEHLDDCGGSSLYGFYAENLQRLYRARVKNQAEYGREELLHIPFNLRQVIDTQRYSIAGFPCLYLAGSVYTCWLEMDKPSLDDFNVSRFQMIKPTNYLDLSMLPRQVIYLFNLIERNSNWGDSQRKALTINDVFSRCIYSFPLLLACSILNVESNSTYHFRSDYVIPQLVMLSLANAEQNIKSIKYVSNKVVGRALPDTEFSFVIIPAQRNTSERISEELCERFAVVQPVNARVLLDMLDNSYNAGEYVRARNDGLYLPHIVKSDAYCGIRSNALQIETVKVNGERCEYRRTPYGKIECALINTGAKIIEPVQ